MLRGIVYVIFYLPFLPFNLFQRLYLDEGVKLLLIGLWFSLSIDAVSIAV